MRKDSTLFVCELDIINTQNNSPKRSHDKKYNVLTDGALYNVLVRTYVYCVRVYGTYRHDGKRLSGEMFSKMFLFNMTVYRTLPLRCYVALYIALLKHMIDASTVSGAHAPRKLRVAICATSPLSFSRMKHIQHGPHPLIARVCVRINILIK